MLDLSKIILDYVKESNISTREAAKILSEARIEVMAELIDPKDGNKYVISKNGSLEKYDEGKIDRSIERASNFIGMPVTYGDVKIISHDVKKYLKSLNRNIYSTSEIRSNIVKSLRDLEYPDTAASYSKQRDYRED